MASLAQVFQDPHSRVVKVIVAIDLTDSTSMKAEHSEVSWLNTYAWFFDQLRTTISKYNGSIVKYLGDGAMAVFSEDHAADAINWAIRVQELFADAQAGSTIDKDCDCSIGIACGMVVEFDVLDGAEGSKDYIGTVADKAFRLCSAANAKAIFIDKDTSDAAAMTRVVSRLGGNTSPRRKVSDYLGREEAVSPKGFPQPITYYEIFWGERRYSVSAPFVTKLAEPPGPQQPLPEKPLTPSQGWMRGVVQSKNDKFGFIRSGQEEFYFNVSCLFRTELSVNWNETVWFMPSDPLPNANKRRAVDVIGMGAILRGRIERLNPQGYGFVVAQTSSGILKQIFVYFGDITAWRLGGLIEFTVSENRKGLIGLAPKPCED
jgi:class 3 adenylate cyclase